MEPLNSGVERPLTVAFALTSYSSPFSFISADPPNISLGPSNSISPFLLSNSYLAVYEIPVPAISPSFSTNSLDSSSSSSSFSSSFAGSSISGSASCSGTASGSASAVAASALRSGCWNATRWATI